VNGSIPFCRGVSDVSLARRLLGRGEFGVAGTEVCLDLQFFGHPFPPASRFFTYPLTIPGFERFFVRCGDRDDCSLLPDCLLLTVTFCVSHHKSSPAFTFSQRGNRFPEDGPSAYRVRFLRVWSPFQKDFFCLCATDRYGGLGVDLRASSTDALVSCPTRSRICYCTCCYATVRYQDQESRTIFSFVFLRVGKIRFISSS